MFSLHKVNDDCNICPVLYCNILVPCIIFNVVCSITVVCFCMSLQQNFGCINFTCQCTTLCAGWSGHLSPVLLTCV